MNINYITGFAGTGKSTHLQNLIKSLNKENTIIITPTHKALQRLNISSHTAKTIHSLLGWVPTINEAAEHINHIETTKKLEDPLRLNSYNNIVIDEGGMMSEEMLLTLTQLIEEVNDYNTDDVTIYIYLDPYQLLPVKGIQIQTDPDTTINLETQYRATSVDIPQLYTKFVEYIKSQGSSSLDLKTPDSANVVNISQKDFKKVYLKEYTNSLNKLNDNSMKILAYTNERVGYYNDVVAKLLDINSYIGKEVQLGSMMDTIRPLYLYKPKELSQEDLLSYYEDGLLHLQNSKISDKYLELEMFRLSNSKYIHFVTYQIDEFSEDTLISPVILGINNAYKLNKAIKTKCINDKKHFSELYTFNRAFTMDYAYASTVHKSQGSEYNIVFIDKSDIKKSILNNTYFITYARLMYVALSRAKNKVYIIN